MSVNGGNEIFSQIIETSDDSSEESTDTSINEESDEYLPQVPEESGVPNSMSSDSSSDIPINEESDEYLPQVSEESGVPSSMSSDNSASSSVRSLEDSSSLKGESSADFELPLPNYVSEIQAIFSDVREGILKEMFYTPPKELSEQSHRKDKNLFPYSNPAPPELQTIRKQLFKEIEKSSQYFPADVIRGMNDESEIHARIGSVLESTSPLCFSSVLTENESRLIKIERKALEHRSMLLYLTMLIIEEFYSFKTVNSVKLDGYYSCFRLTIKENAESKIELSSLKGDEHGNRYQRIQRLVKKNDKSIGYIWYGFFLARYQAGFEVEIAKMMLNRIGSIYDELENFEIMVTSELDTPRCI
ncbi:hypothetical protein TNCT_321541 [Trichonephila clavata]|uniref:Uncharacterized protein n=1 Tax=Trichonephila clavata TaxID=2740835 RepID=A0A8X6FT35_TRICU|nr:hypothetical protein TNCT_321541 [Trichonephila clavata]